jgi:predicted DNA-binding protein
METLINTQLQLFHCEKMGKKTGHTVFLDPEDVEFLQEKSRKTGRSFSTMIREAVKKWIQEERAK